MDRQIVYNGQLPLETDVLNTNIYAMVALGRLAMDVFGTGTVVSGLACSATSVPSMKVNIAAGAIYALENIDDTAYSSLPADTSDQIVKQGILKTSDAAQLTMTAPTTPGYSMIYLVQAAYQDLDSGSAVLNYYDAANPGVPYSGPNNSNTAQPTIRAGKVALVAKAGVAATSPVVPTADAGYVALYQITVAYGQTTITGSNIAVATGAPFLTGSLADLANYVTKSVMISSIGQFQYDDHLVAGTFSVTAPAWANHAEITVVGGGGGGGPSATGYAGGGGGAGGYVQGVVSVTPGAAYSAIVGAGGASGTSGTGGSGGTSSFGTFATANGGAGGQAGTVTSAGGGGGTASGPGLRAFSGGCGGDGNITSSSSQGGNGASGPFGGEGRTGANGGVAGAAPGAGGGGSWAATGSGGAGAPGAVLIKWLP